MAGEPLINALSSCLAAVAKGNGGKGTGGKGKGNGGNGKGVGRAVATRMFPNQHQSNSTLQVKLQKRRLKRLQLCWKQVAETHLVFLVELPQP